MKIFFANQWLCPEWGYNVRHSMNSISLSNNTLCWLEDNYDGGLKNLCFIKDFDQIFNRFAWELHPNVNLDRCQTKSQYDELHLLCDKLHDIDVSENNEYLESITIPDGSSSGYILSLLNKLDKPSTLSQLPPKHYSFSIPNLDTSTYCISYDGDSEFCIYLSDHNGFKANLNLNILSYQVKLKTCSKWYKEIDKHDEYIILDWREIPNYPSLCRELVRQLKLPENKAIRRNLWHLDQVIIRKT